MQTSYFAKSGKEPNAVCIALYPPRWFPDMRTFPLLAPNGSTLKKWKDSESGNGPTFTWKEYVEEYQHTVLSKLDPRETFDALGEEAILCCYEKSSEPCHRHIVAQWFSINLGIDIPEV